MTAANFKAVVELPRLSGIPADAVVNDWHFHWDDTGTDPGTTDFDKITEALRNFYDVANTGQTNAVSFYIAETIDRGHEWPVTIYKVPTVRGPLGAPVYGSSFAVTHGSSGNPYPAEVAMALSFRSDYGSDVEFASGSRPRSTHRGRVYIGPLEGALGTEDGTTHEEFLSTAMMTDLAQAARMSFSVASPGVVFSGTHWSWQQFSPKLWLGRLVTEAWADNAYDIQRRRGQAATARVTKAIV